MPFAGKQRGEHILSNKEVSTSFYFYLILFYTNDCYFKMGEGGGGLDTFVAASQL